MVGLLVALAASSEIPDLLPVPVPVGGRVVVLADLHLREDPTAGQLAATGELATAVEAATGPGVLIIAGNLFDSGVDPQAALAAHVRLVRDIAGYSAGAGPSGGGPSRRPGYASGLVWPRARLPLSPNWAPSWPWQWNCRSITGAGRRQVRVEPGHNFDALSRFNDPRNPGESPYAQHIREELLPSVRRRQKGLTGSGTGWLSGMEHLDDPAAFSRFIASRLAYRRLGRSAWLLLIPLAAVLALRLPSLALRSAWAGALTTRLGIPGGVHVHRAAPAGADRRGGPAPHHSSLVSRRSQREWSRPQRRPRAAARDLVTGGYAAVITAHTCRPELTHLGAGFYANVGCGSDLVTEVPSRLPGLGLPSVFLAYRETAWVELEAGSDLHARLFHARQDLPGATLLERILAQRVVESSGRETRPKVVATFPQGEGWPRSHVAEIRNRRVRRLASLLVFVAGFLSLLSALSEPIRDRLNVVHSLFPMAVPETAAALAALAGIGLIELGRGIRRGQRRAWLVCLALLLAVAVLHLIKGVDIEEALIALASAAYLWLHRSSFQAKTDVARLGRGLLGVGLAAGLTVIAGTLAIKLASLLDPDSHSLRQLSWMQAALTSVERMVGISHLSLPEPAQQFLRTGHGYGDARTGRGVDGGGVPPGGPAPPRRGRCRRQATLIADWLGPEPSWPATARGPWTTSPCDPTSSSFSQGDTVVAHAVYGGVCLVSPDPIGPIRRTGGGLAGLSPLRRRARVDAWRAGRR